MASGIVGLHVKVANPAVRVCAHAHCEISLDGYRRQARYCGGPHRAAASRARADKARDALSVQVVEETAQKRTGAARTASPPGTRSAEARWRTAHDDRRLADVTSGELLATFPGASFLTAAQVDAIDADVWDFTQPREAA